MPIPVVRQVLVFYPVLRKLSQLASWSSLTQHSAICRDHHRTAVELHVAVGAEAEHVRLEIGAAVQTTESLDVRAF